MNPQMKAITGKENRIQEVKNLVQVVKDWLVAKKPLTACNVHH